jgi:hypothetical protein
MAERGANIMDREGIQRGDTASDIGRGVTEYIAITQVPNIPDLRNAPVPDSIAGAYPQAQPGLGLNSSLNIFGLNIPIWVVIAGVALLYLKGK